MKAFRFDRAPVRVYWELTRACDLACRHCRAESIPARAADELTTGECVGILQALSAAGQPPPHVVFTGGDPLKRPDLMALIHQGTALGLSVSLAPSATGALTADCVRSLKAAGVSAMSLSLDGHMAAHHDALRGVFGCFGWTLAAAQRIVAAGIPLQINTLVTADTEPHLEDIAMLVARLGAARWSLFFLVPTGRGSTLRPLEPRACELRLRWLAAQNSRWPFVATTTETPHYRRILIQQMRAAGRTAAEILAHPAARGFGVRDGNGIMFIAANGDIRPSGFLPLVAANVRHAHPLTVYRDAPLFRALRLPALFDGRCGACEFGEVCGGSRARAWAVTGNERGEDPLCAHSPASWGPRASLGCPRPDPEARAASITTESLTLEAAHPLP